MAVDLIPDRKNMIISKLIQSKSIFSLGMSMG
jgi:hypothetical protein